MILSTMKLNEGSKDDIRKLIAEGLSNVNNGERIKFDKDLLEELMFLKIIYDGDKCIKIPVWFGDFLGKIDLSEVDFEDVSYSVLYDIFVDKLNSKYDNVYKLVKEKIPSRKIPQMIYYANTNANIDFKKSFEYKNNKVIRIHGCNFIGTDLSNNDIDSTFSIIQSYFENTNLKISTIRTDSFAENSDFTGIDLSYYVINIRQLLDYGNVFGRCGIRYTGINITGVSRDGMGEYLDDYLFKYHDGCFDGCYINGVYVKSNHQLLINKAELKKQYDGEVVELKTRIRKTIEAYKQ